MTTTLKKIRIKPPSRERQNYRKIGTQKHGSEIECSTVLIAGLLKEGRKLDSLSLGGEAIKKPLDHDKEKHINRWSFAGKLVLTFSILFFNIVPTSPSAAETLRLAWNANTESDLAGNKNYKCTLPSQDFEQSIFSKFPNNPSSPSNSIAAISPALNGATYVQTANDEEFSAGSTFLAFDVNQPVTVCVVHDDQYLSKPTWLNAFTATGERLQSGFGPFSLYAWEFPAERITLGGNSPNETGGFSIYTVIVIPATQQINAYTANAGSTVNQVSRSRSQPPGTTYTNALQATNAVVKVSVASFSQSQFDTLLKWGPNTETDIAG